MQTALPPPDEADDLPPRGGKVTAWRQPVVWLGMLIFVTSLVGCLTMIVLASRHDDPLLDTGGGHLMKVPLSRSTGQPATLPRAPPVE
jgi:hypothetical protein